MEESSLTSENYSNAWTISNERYRNPQLKTSCNMNKLLELELVNGVNVTDLRDLLN